ncbi:TPA: hypothetical protein IAB95_03085 [Candidatus Ventrenecus avicola]|nr:hypothetical protein [Candidatus Ventrenecus avicola]
MENKKNIKIVVALIVCFVIYMFVVFLLSPKEKGTSGYLIHSGITSFYCQNAVCEYVSDSRVSTSSKEFSIYQYNEYVDTYQMSYQTDTWNFFKDGSWQAVYGDFLAIDTSLDFEYLPYETEEIPSSVRDLLTETTGISYESLNNQQVFSLDLNENGEQDYIYAFSNQVEEETGQDYFSVFFIELDGTIQMIYRETSLDSDSYSLPFYRLAGVVKVDGIVKIIVNKGYFSSQGNSSSILLTFDGEQFIEEAKPE